MRRVIDKPGCMTGSGIGWALASSAAAHVALGAALVLCGAAGGFGGRPATFAVVDLVPGVPGSGGGVPSGTSSPGPPRGTPGRLPSPGPTDAPLRGAEARPSALGPARLPAAEAVGETTGADSALRLPERSASVPAGGTSTVPAAPGPAMEQGLARAGPAPDDAPRGSPYGPATAPAGAEAEGGGTAGAASGLLPGAEGTDGGKGWSGGGGRIGLLRDRIQSRIVYPEEAVRRGLEGEVLLRIRIETGGNPGEVRVARSSGARLLDEAARRGVVRAAPLPASPGWVEVPVLFRLR